MAKRNPATHQAPDSTPAAATADDGESTRKKVSQRAYIDANAAEVDKIELASGGRYVLLDPAGNHTFDELFGDPGKFDTMAAVFGFHTKIGNVANTVLNDKDEPGTPADAANAIKEWLAAAKSGTWAERAGGVAVRIDKDKLAGAIVSVAESKGKVADYQKIRDKLESDPQYVRAARQVPEVATAYAAAVGKATKSVDDLL